MYPDPKSVRDNRMTLRLNDAEMAVIMSMAQYIGAQPATMARELLMQQAAEAWRLTSNVSRDAA